MGTIDQKIYDLIQEKRSIVDIATDGASDVEMQSLASALVSLFTEQAFE